MAATIQKLAKTATITIPAMTPALIFEPEWDDDESEEVSTEGSAMMLMKNEEIRTLLMTYQCVIRTSAHP